MLTAYIVGAIVSFPLFFLTFAVWMSILEKRSFGDRGPDDYATIGITSFFISFLWPIALPVTIMLSSGYLVGGFINKVVGQLTELVKKISV